MNQISRDDIRAALNVLDFVKIHKTLPEQDLIDKTSETIRTLIANALDERFVTVPREPNRNMIDAGYSTDKKDKRGEWIYSTHADIYKAMIAAYKPSEDGI